MDMAGLHNDVTEIIGRALVYLIRDPMVKLSHNNLLEDVALRYRNDPIYNAWVQKITAEIMQRVHEREK